MTTVFGWSENREDGKHRVENSIFHCLAKERKWRGRKIREKVLSWAHNFHPPKSGGKSGEESAVKALLPKCPLPTSTTTQRGKIRRKQKITTKPRATTKHRNLAQKTKTYHNQNRNSKPNQKI